MLATAPALARRHRFHGVGQIVRFNWPSYACASAVVLFALAIVERLPLDGLPRGLVYVATGLALLWVAASLLASWLIYDRSPLMTGMWIPETLGFCPRVWLNIHSGLDESTPILRELFASPGRALDIFDPAAMTESSIVRARRRALHDSEPADFRHLPAPTGTIGAVFFLLSAHELRTHPERRALFAEASRVLAAGGRIVVAEHLRDWPNFLAFGPGFLHFHPERAWKRCFSDAGLAIQAEFSITPFVRVFILRKPS